ncbi:MAG: C40 family peptidase [Chitinophagaceae bacterium]|nr:C40 family peptidase [Chitinophagaceae bacterium]
MTRTNLLAITFLFVMASCSSIKPLNLSKEEPGNISATKNKQVKFIDDITLIPESSVTEVKTEKKFTVTRYVKSSGPSAANYNVSPDIESSSAIQIKYSLLLNTEIEQVQSTKMYEYIDTWYGTPYCYGGSSKKCIDCSAFVQTFFISMYGTMLPRTAREQYKEAKRISRTELEEGDLLFFNTTGGVSHVGVYLQNNKFVHASSSSGVIISDMFEPFWVTRLISVGRVSKNADVNP